MQHLILQTMSLTLFGRRVASLSDENPCGISSVNYATPFFFPPPNFFQSHYFLSSTYHFFLPLAGVTAAISTAYPPRHILLRISGTDTEHLHQTDLQCHHHATHHVHLSTKMSVGKCSWCHADVWQAVLMFIWLMSMRSSGADPAHQAAAGCLPEDAWSITLGPALLRTIKRLGPGVQVKRRWAELLLCTHTLLSYMRF